MKIEVISFAYKSQLPPKANLLFDVRFIDNPFWVEELRPLNGLSIEVKNFVLQQAVSDKFLAAFADMVKAVLPLHETSIKAKLGTASQIEDVFVVAFGCTGGWHRSVVVADAAAKIIATLFPNYEVCVVHREIEKSAINQSKERAK